MPHAVEYFNFAEAAFWILAGLGFIIAAHRTAGPSKKTFALAVPVLILFGLSDLVETQTHAWWRPWWLPLWKAACLIAGAVLLIRYFKHRNPPHSETKP